MVRCSCFKRSAFAQKPKLLRNVHFVWRYWKPKMFPSPSTIPYFDYGHFENVRDHIPFHIAFSNFSLLFFLAIAAITTIGIPRFIYGKYKRKNPHINWIENFCTYISRLFCDNIALRLLQHSLPSMRPHLRLYICHIYSVQYSLCNSIRAFSIVSLANGAFISMHAHMLLHSYNNKKNNPDIGPTSTT